MEEVIVLYLDDLGSDASDDGDPVLLIGVDGLDVLREGLFEGHMKLIHLLQRGFILLK